MISLKSSTIAKIVGVEQVIKFAWSLFLSLSASLNWLFKSDIFKIGPVLKNAALRTTLESGVDAFQRLCIPKYGTTQDKGDFEGVTTSASWQFDRFANANHEALSSRDSYILSLFDTLTGK